MARYRLQTMAIQQVAEDTSTIRSLDWDRDRFDIEFRLERGTTYNSYIIKGDKVRIFSVTKRTARVWEIDGKHNVLAWHTLNASYIWREVPRPLTWWRSWKILWNINKQVFGKMVLQTWDWVCILSSVTGLSDDFTPNYGMRLWLFEYRIVNVVVLSMRFDRFHCWNSKEIHAVTLAGGH